MTTDHKIDMEIVWRRALSFYWFSSAAGVGKLVPKLDLVRYLEYPLAYESLDLSDGQSILDIGAGYSIFPLYLIATRRCSVHITDNEEHLAGVVRFHRVKLAKLARRDRTAVSRATVERQDARHLTYSDNAFDRVSCISVIEHIPDEGDSAAMREIGRVLRPGGRAVVTVPYASEYAERESSPWVEYFERSYDREALDRRLVQPSGLYERLRLFFGVRPNRLSAFGYRSAMPWARAAVHILAPLVTPRITTIGTTADQTSHGVLLVLDKMA